MWKMDAWRVRIILAQLSPPGSSVKLTCRLASSNPDPVA